MAVQLPPIPNNPITDVFVWRDWFFKVAQQLTQAASISWNTINFTGSNITDIATRQHGSLQGLQGGTGGQYYHLTQAEHALIAVLPTGLTVTITTAALTPTGTQGSMTFTGGVLTSQTQAT